MSSRKLAKEVMDLCQIGWADESTDLISWLLHKWGNGCFSMGRINRHRFSPNFFAKFRAVSQDSALLPNHRISLLYFSNVGNTCWGRFFTPYGRQITLLEILAFNKTKKSDMLGTKMALSLDFVDFPVSRPVHKG